MGFTEEEGRTGRGHSLNSRQMHKTTVAQSQGSRVGLAASYLVRTISKVRKREQKWRSNRKLALNVIITTIVIVNLKRPGPSHGQSMGSKCPSN